MGECKTDEGDAVSLICSVLPSSVQVRVFVYANYKTKEGGGTDDREYDAPHKDKGDDFG